MNQQPPPGSRPDATHTRGDNVGWERFDSDAHRAAQGNCRCVIACAVDGETRRGVAEHLAYARGIGDMTMVPILIAQLTGPCILAPVQKER